MRHWTMKSDVKMNLKEKSKTMDAFPDKRPML